MSRPLMVPPDLEGDIIDVLNASTHVEADAGLRLPDGWTPASDPFVTVAVVPLTSTVDGPVVHATVNVVAWASGPTAAKQLAATCLAVLDAHPGDPSPSQIVALSGPVGAFDADTGGHMASVTVRAGARRTVFTVDP